MADKVQKRVRRKKAGTSLRPHKPTKRTVVARHNPSATSTRRPSGDMRRVQSALDRMVQAQSQLAARSADLLGVASEIARAAVARHENSLIRSLAEEQLLREILALRDWFAAAPPEGLPDGLAQFQLLPEAMLNWLEEHFGLAPHLAAGQELEIPASKTAAFAFEGDGPVEANTLVRVTVLQAGWKRGNVTVLPPLVRLARPEAVEEPG